MEALIVIGDKTSHGGTVISCSRTCDTHGKGWARVGDKVACPRCKGVFPISEGDRALTDHGRAVAYHGCRVACGARLIASHRSTFTDPARNGAASGANPAASPRPGFGEVDAGVAAGYEDEKAAGPAPRFRGRFQLLDAATGKPLPGKMTRVRTADGRHVTAATDADGCTPWIERDAAEELTLELVEDGQA